MEPSILKSIKKILGLPPSHTEFDIDVVMHINSVFSTLTELGIGPIEGFSIDGEAEVWDDYLADDARLNNVRTYVYLRVRMLFDPPTTGYHVEAVKEQIKELEWRLNVIREGDEWQPGIEA